jgi:hypothetical protein
MADTFTVGGRGRTRHDSARDDDGSLYKSRRVTKSKGTDRGRRSKAWWRRPAAPCYTTLAVTDACQPKVFYLFSLVRCGGLFSFLSAFARAASDDGTCEVFCALESRRGFGVEGGTDP